MPKPSWVNDGYLELEPGVIAYIIVREGDVNSPAGVAYHEYNAPTLDEVVKLCIKHGFDPNCTMELINTRSQSSHGFIFDAEVFRANQP